VKNVSARSFAGAVLAASFFAFAAAARADAPGQSYAMSGADTFSAAGREVRTEIVYAGTQRLTIRHDGPLTRFSADATYERREGGTDTHATAFFSSTVLPGGEQRDDGDGDPDYLTILNQPFSIELDAPTMHDLRNLAGAVPFDFPSPMTGAPLHGSLRRLPDGLLGGRRVLGIAFTAHGSLDGAPPDRPELALHGTITMNGTAYYAYADALLLALDATLDIEGRIAGGGQNEPVTIVYKRTIRPQAP
jgi:hypothetical protein